MRLTDLTYEGGQLSWRSRHASEPESVLPSYLVEAERIFQQAGERFKTLEIGDTREKTAFEALRWFPLPGEALSLLRGDMEEYPQRTSIQLP